MKNYYTKQNTLKFFCALLILGFSFNLFAQDRAPRLSVSAALGIPATMFSVNSKFIGIYTGAARYSFNKSWSLEAKVTAHTFFNNATGNVRKTSLDGTASDILTYRTPNYGLNGIVYYNLHKIFGLDNKPDARFLPFVNFGGGLNWYKPSVSFANGTVGGATSFGKPYRDYQLGLGSRFYLNYLIDLYAGAEYHYVESYFLDGFKEVNNPSLDTYMNFYAGLSIKLGAKKHANLLDWSHKNVAKEAENPVIEEPKIEAMPIVVEPNPVVEPAPTLAPTPIVEPVPTSTKVPIQTPTPTPTPTTSPVARPRPAQALAQPRATEPAKNETKNTKTNDLNNEVTPPPSRYNVIVGCYSINKLAVAQYAQRSLVNKGFNPSLYRSSSNSRMLRLAIISTDNRVEAIKILRQARKEVEPGSWLYIYNAQ
jgi:hypothetical protein